MVSVRSAIVAAAAELLALFFFIRAVIYDLK